MMGDTKGNHLKTRLLLTMSLMALGACAATTTTRQIGLNNSYKNVTEHQTRVEAIGQGGIGADQANEIAKIRYQQKDIPNYCMSSADVSEGVRYLEKLFSRIREWRTSRKTFLKDLLERLLFKMAQGDGGKRYNIMVVNLEVQFTNSVEGKYVYESHNFDGTIYGVWLLQKGKFALYGSNFGESWIYHGRYLNLQGANRADRQDIVFS